MREKTWSWVRKKMERSRRKWNWWSKYVIWKHSHTQRRVLFFLYLLLSLSFERDSGLKILFQVLGILYFLLNTSHYQRPICIYFYGVTDCSFVHILFSISPLVWEECGIHFLYYLIQWCVLHIYSILWFHYAIFLHSL